MINMLEFRFTRGICLNKLQPLIEGKLAVGPKPTSLDDLKIEGITAIIDLNQDFREMNSAKEIELKYCCDPLLKIEDNSEPIKVDVLEYVTKTIDRLISEGYYVYLHCTASRGRSPTIAAAYLIRRGMTKNEAMNKVSTVRPEAWRGSDKKFAFFLDEFEKKCRSRRRGA